MTLLVKSASPFTPLPETLSRGLRGGAFPRGQGSLGIPVLASACRHRL
jgi:hypothetical protein